MNQLGSIDSSRDFQLNCVISYFLPIFTTSCMDPKIDVIKRVEKILTFGVHLNKAYVSARGPDILL
jgi:hypothetical protein